MRLANLSGRAALIVGDLAADVAEESDGAFGPELAGIYENWAAFTAWASHWNGAATAKFDPADLGPPSPAPRQIFAIGLNYADHAAEASMTVPEVPATFTKFQTCLTGPFADVKLPSAHVDWEVEMVVVIGKHGAHIAAADAWNHVAGVTIGQDYSERAVQIIGPAPQYSMAKSYPGFGPTGPWLVTLDEVGDAANLAIECYVNGERMQCARTSDMIFSVPALIQWLSAITPLLPGDIIFTGTPSGVGFVRQPQRLLKVGDVVESRIEGIGMIRQNCL